MSRLYIGFDIGSETHRYCVMNELHETLIRGSLKHSIREISKFIEELKALKSDAMMVGMEGSNARRCGLQACSH